MMTWGVEWHPATTRAVPTIIPNKLFFIFIPLNALNQIIMIKININPIIIIKIKDWAGGVQEFNVGLSYIGREMIEYSYKPYE